MAEKYFALDSFNLAINGNAEFAGLLEITDNYGSTKSGNLAHYYLGISFLRTGQYEAAISELENFSSDDVVISTMAIGAIGDAYMELGDLNKAASNYDKAASNDENSFTSAYFLMKSGKTFEIIGDHSEAVERYTTIKNDFNKSAEAAQVDKLISRAESFVK
jgi:tetratricopeptide (TPR) repeat protein